MSEESDKRVESLRGKAAISGIGETEIGRVPDKNSMDLHLEAAQLALRDAGITKDDLDAVITCGSMVEYNPRHHVTFAEYLGVPIRRLNETGMTGGTSVNSGIRLAAMAIAAGQCTTALVVSADNLLSGLSRDGAVGHLAQYHNAEFELPYGPLIISFYALVARRFMEQFGWTSEQLAQVSVSTRKNAQKNPKAQMRDPITIQDVVTSKMVTSPLRLLDCAVISDGGGAIVVTSAERAADGPNTPIYILGTGSAYSHYYIWGLPNHTSFLTDLIAESGRAAYEMAGLGPSDMDVVMVPDAVSPSVPIQLEAFGFCERGEGASFVQGGRIEIGGELPVNTHGGCLSAVHPGNPAQIFHLIEAVRQLRCIAGERQVPNARVALSHGAAGVYTSNCTLILSNER